MKSEKHKEILVFIVRRDTKCSECGEELWSGSFLYLEKDKALCLSCADLDQLEYLHSGDPALTRRSIKHSKIHAKVLKWSRTRNRYERQLGGWGQVLQSSISETIENLVHHSPYLSQGALV